MDIFQMEEEMKIEGRHYPSVSHRRKLWTLATYLMFLSMVSHLGFYLNITFTKFATKLHNNM